MASKKTDKGIAPFPEWNELIPAERPPSKESSDTANARAWVRAVAARGASQWFVVPGGPVVKRDALGRARQLRRVAKQDGIEGFEVWTEIAQPNPRTTPGMAGKPQLYIITARIKPASPTTATRAASEPSTAPTPPAPATPPPAGYEHRYEQPAI